jgi:hypothetical protein
MPLRWRAVEIAIDGKARSYRDRDQRPVVGIRPRRWPQYVGSLRISALDAGAATRSTFRFRQRATQTTSFCPVPPRCWCAAPIRSPAPGEHPFEKTPPAFANGAQVYA